MEARRRGAVGPDFFSSSPSSSSPSSSAAAAAAAAASSSARDDGALVAARPLEENCGVYGVVGAPNASRAVFFAL